MKTNGAGLMEETGTLQTGQQTSPTMVGGIRNTFQQTFVRMANGMTTMETLLGNFFVSIPQVLQDTLHILLHTNIYSVIFFNATRGEGL